MDLVNGSLSMTNHSISLNFNENFKKYTIAQVCNIRFCLKLLAKSIITLEWNLQNRLFRASGWLCHEKFLKKNRNSFKPTHSFEKKVVGVRLIESRHRFTFVLSLKKWFVRQVSNQNEWQFGIVISNYKFMAQFIKRANMVAAFDHTVFHRITIAFFQMDWNRTRSNPIGNPFGGFFKPTNASLFYRTY